MKRAKFGDWKSTENAKERYFGRIKVYLDNKDISRYVETPITIYDDDGEMEKILPKLKWRKVR